MKSRETSETGSASWKAGALLVAGLAFFTGVGALQPACEGEGRCKEARRISVPEGLGEHDEYPEMVVYDYLEVVEPITVADLGEIHDLSRSVRLILGEVGADRLLLNRYGPVEAMAILYSIDNRRDPSAYNPDGRPSAPHYPGCAPEMPKARCADPAEYLGLTSRRALRPAEVYAPTVLQAAVDRAVLVWWLKQQGWAGDPTGGATSFVHRCGGEAYGQTTQHCDGHVGDPGDDTPGAEPSTGPLVFKGPKRWDSERGVYRLGVTGWVDHDPWWDSRAGRSLGHRIEATYRLAGLQHAELYEAWIEAWGPTVDRAALDALTHNGGLKTHSD